ncbi:hypothetical protein EDF56_102214 [Novosphingobium sp. PhB165]|uniref:hypothetical protein n=1 Tax=Novosphingobium sp. PhB165 TaxID=2485105 RepID=UPI0010CF8961|nr:hypothetical protein [Novosphingobium sp. PhB165]TCM20553.1 hypothetical protein EDF56_102214 [Novosphingobium sp. PhB165]
MRFPSGKAFVLTLSAMVAAGVAAASASAATPSPLMAPLDLKAPFAARSAWRLTATQGPQVEDPADGEMVPGAISLCLTRDNGRNCDPAPNRALRLSSGDDLFVQPHFLRRAQVVRPSSERPLLLIELASFHSGNGDQRVSLQLYAYDRANDAFRLAYERRTNRNNNQEIRYVESGPLAGAVIAADPTDDAPFGYWISVSRPDTAGTYRQVLRFRSATAYGDGNPLAVIDSEMPNIQRRLGIWRPGMALPLPAKPCPRPHMVNEALWCD